MDCVSCVYARMCHNACASVHVFCVIDDCCHVRQCAGRLTCKLKCDHPPTGTEFSLGCGVCNNESTQVIRKPIDSDDKAKGEADAGGDGGGGVLNAVRNMFSKPAPAKKADAPNKRRASRGKK